MIESIIYGFNIKELTDVLPTELTAQNTRLQDAGLTQEQHSITPPPPTTSELMVASISLVKSTLLF
jgi:hypothetical protein